MTEEEPLGGIGSGPQTTHFFGFTCEQCQAPFIVTSRSRERRFCSNRCRFASMCAPKKATCEQCGELFAATKKLTRFCCDKCYFAFKRAHRQMFTCEVCGTRFPLQEGGKGANRACSRECGFEVQRRDILANPRPKAPKFTAVKFKPCIVCSRAFPHRYPHQVACKIHRDEYSYAKQLQRLRDTYIPIPKRPMTCTQCGKDFLGSGKQTFCSAKCARAICSKRRRARDHRIHMPVGFNDVWRKTSGVCYICGYRCLRPGSLPLSLTGTMDHVIPLAMGGLHILPNMSLAHQICNSVKGASLPTAEITRHSRQRIRSIRSIAK